MPLSTSLYLGNKLSTSPLFRVLTYFCSFNPGKGVQMSKTLVATEEDVPLADLPLRNVNKSASSDIPPSEEASKGAASEKEGAASSLA